MVRRSDADDGPTTERLDVVDASLEPPKKVGSLKLVDHRPRDLAVRIDKLVIKNQLRSTHAPLALFATVDALVQRGYRRIAWRVLEPKDAALAEATGFSLEGVLRKYCIEDGCSRDARLYSVLNTDWRERRPVVAARLDVVDAQLDAAWTLKDCCAPAPRKKNT